jgi:hypothetical protein
VLDLQPVHVPVAAQIGQAEGIPLVAGHHAEGALRGNTRTRSDQDAGPAVRATNA